MNPKNDKLWQRPKESFYDDDSVWYNNIPLGKKTLSSFMSRISELCSLSCKYTNHSIRATGATLLSRSMFNPAQIMAVTGHKSVSSLAVYQRVSDSEKVAMGKAIASSIDKSLVPMDNKDDDLFQSIDVQSLQLESHCSNFSLEKFPIFKGCQINNLTINMNK